MAYDNSVFAAHETQRLRVYDQRFQAALRREDAVAIRVEHANLRGMAESALALGCKSDPTSAGFYREATNTYRRADAELAGWSARNAVREADHRRVREEHAIGGAMAGAAAVAGVSCLVSRMCQPLDPGRWDANVPWGRLFFGFLALYCAVAFWAFTLPLALAAGCLVGSFADRNTPIWVTRACRVVGLHAAVILGFVVASCFLDASACTQAYRAAFLPVTLAVLAATAV